MTDAPVSVVTGANSGIGRATAIHLAQHGHVVYGTVRATSRKDKMQAMVDEAGVEVRLVELDVAEDDSVRDGFARILDEAGRVDHLVNNAGVGGNAVVEEGSPALYLDVMNVNLCGAVRCLQAVLPQMRERGSRLDRQRHLDRRAGGVDRPVAVRRIEVRARGAERGPGPGAGAIRHPCRDHRARSHEVGDLRQVGGRPERRPARTTRRIDGCSSSTPPGWSTRPIRSRWPR